MRRGVAPDEPFVNRLIAATDVDQTRELAREEVRKATGRNTDFILVDGDPFEMKRLALSAVHWFRLHPEVPAQALSVQRIPARGDVTYAAVANPGLQTVAFNADLFGAGRRGELERFWALGEDTGQLRRDPELATPILVFHELEHLRYDHYGGLPDLLKGKQPARGVPNNPSAAVAKVASYTKTAKDLVKRHPDIKLVTNHSVAKYFGTYPATNTAETFVEGSGHLHAQGDGAPKLARIVAEPLGSVDEIAAAAPGFRQALRRVDTEVDRDTGLPKSPGQLAREAAGRVNEARPETARPNPWLTRNNGGRPPSEGSAVSGANAAPATDGHTGPEPGQSASAIRFGLPPAASRGMSHMSRAPSESPTPPTAPGVLPTPPGHVQRRQPNRAAEARGVSMQRDP
ncbi:hypothetical protein [Yinghuangia aomiensis]